LKPARLRNQNFDLSGYSGLQTGKVARTFLKIGPMRGHRIDDFGRGHTEVLPEKTVLQPGTRHSLPLGVSRPAGLCPGGLFALQILPGSSFL